MDLTKKLDRDTYRESLRELQTSLNELTWRAYNAKRSLVMVYEGVDAGGKGGNIRRVTGAVDARLYRVISIAALCPRREIGGNCANWRREFTLAAST